jgi:hypothetical protein
MRRVMLRLAFGVAVAVLATPAYAEWTGKQINDGVGHSYFLLSAKTDNARAEIFCGSEGVVNFSLIWPDWKHRNAADKGEPVNMRIRTDAGASFEAKSYYWASGKGRLILDYGNPMQVRAIVDALGAATSDITVSVDDAANGIQKTEQFDTEGAADATAAFHDWCPSGE